MIWKLDSCYFCIKYQSLQTLFTSILKTFWRELLLGFESTKKIAAFTWMIFSGEDYSMFCLMVELPQELIILTIGHNGILIVSVTSSLPGFLWRTDSAGFFVDIFLMCLNLQFLFILAEKWQFRSTHWDITLVTYPALVDIRLETSIIV